MKISRQLIVNAVLPVALAATVAVALTVFGSRVARIQDRDAVIRDIAADAATLSVLAHEISGDRFLARARAQWDIVYDRIEGRLADVSFRQEDPTHLLRQLRELHASVGKFYLLMSDETVQLAAASGVDGWELQIARGGLLLQHKTKDMVFNALSLLETSEARLKEVRRQKDRFILSITILLGLALSVIAVRLNRQLTRRIGDLESGMTRIGGGDRAFRFNDSRRDELAALSTGIDQTLDRLDATTTSLDRLEAEMALRRGREQELTASEERFRAVFEHAPIGIALLDSEGNMLSSNPALQSMLGYTATVLARKGLSEVAIDAYRGEGEDLFGQLVDGRMPSYRLTRRYVATDSETVWANLTVSAIRAADKADTRVIALFENVTQQKHTEEMLQAEREQLRALFDGIEEGIYVADPETYELLYSNAAARSHWGLDLEGARCHEALYGRAEPCPFCTNDRIFGANLGNTHVWAFRNEKTGRWLRCSDKAIRWPDGRMVRFELASDNTAMKQAEAQRTRLEKLSALGQLTAGVAHELNNPLMGIINYAQYCQAAAPRGKDCSAILGDIEKETRRCIEIVHGLLDYSRGGHQQQYEAREVDLRDLAARTVALLDFRTRNEGINLTMDIGDNLAAVIIKAGALQQVLMNLLTNAFDAVQDTEEKAVSIRARAESERIVMQISDSGTGIAEIDMNKIYDPFFTTKPPGKGTGLGLSTVWAILEEEGGRIGCFSRAGRGTDMVVEFPFKRSAD